MADKKEMFSQFHALWSAVNAAYEQYAKEIGMSYSALQTLCEIYHAPAAVTQRTICETTHLPKTTVNAIILGFVRQGYVRLAESADDRRQKNIVLTKKGAAFAQPIMEHMGASELAAFEMLDDGTAAAMLSGIGQYQKYFDERLNHSETKSL